MIGYAHLNYPALLAELADLPSLLYARGSLDVLYLPAIAVVGARKATPSGREITHSVVSQWMALKWVIVSGLAIGIDRAAHEAALDGGSTIAVCVTGLDRVYPQRNRALSAGIAQTRLLVS